MNVDNAGRGQYPSSPLRKSQASTTRLSESDKLMGTITHKPDMLDMTEEDDSVAIQLPADDAGNSLSVRPASKHGGMVTADLSWLNKKLKGSRESQTNKRKQSEADIGADDGGNGSLSKRQRTEDTTIPHARAPGGAHGNPYGNPIDQPATQAVPRPVDQTSVNRPDHALDVASFMQVQTAMATALGMASSINYFQPQQISELFQHLCRTQLWPLLKLEEQRAQYLLNIHGSLRVPYGAVSTAGTGTFMAVNASSSSVTTLPDSLTVIPPAGTTFTPGVAMARRPPLSEPPPTARPPVPTIRPSQAAQRINAGRVDEHRLPDPPNPPSPEYARRLLSSLREEAQAMMRLPASSICFRLKASSSDPESINNVTAFTAFLVEIVSHQGLPHLDGEVDNIIRTLLEIYLTGHRRLESMVRAARKAGTEEIRSDLDPIYAYVLRLLPKYLQFARVLGKGINSLTREKRMHLGLARRFNHVLILIGRRHALSAAKFDQELNAIIDAPVSRRSTTSNKSASEGESTTTTVPTEGGELDSDEGGDGDI